MCWTSPKNTYIFKVENRSLQPSDAHGAECVAIGPVSTANAVGHIAARLLDSSRTVESRERHATLQILKAYDLTSNPQKSLADADANQLWLDNRYTVNGLLVIPILLQ